MKSSLYTIAGAAAIGLIAKAKSASANIKHDIFNPSNVHSSTSAYKLMEQCNKGFKDGSIVGAELIGNSSKLVDTIQDESINAIITSPPYYGIANYTNNQAEIGAPNSGKLRYIEELVTLFVNLKSKLKNDGTLWVNLGAKNIDQDIFSTFNAAMQSNGWKVIQRIIWAKSNPLPKPISKNDGTIKFSSDTEIIFVYAKKESVKNKIFKLHSLLMPTTSTKTYDKTKSRTNQGNFVSQKMETPKTVKNQKKMGTLWASGNVKPITSNRKNGLIFDKRFGNTEYEYRKRSFMKAEHVAIMNPIIVRNCIWASTKPGDVILDPFSGTGTVTNIAKMMGRIGIGFELDTIHALMAVVGKDFSYTDKWKQVKLRDERNKKLRTTEPLPYNHPDYQMNLKEVSKGITHLLREDVPYKTELINFNTVSFSDNPLWKHIKIDPNSQEIRNKAKETIKNLLAIIYGEEGE